MSPRPPRRLWSFVFSAILSLWAIPFCGAQTPTPAPTPSPQARDNNNKPLSSEDLIEIFAQHREWVSSKGKKGKAADLKGFRLDEIKLQPLILAAHKRNAGDKPADLMVRLITSDQRLLRLTSLPDLDLRGAWLYKWNLDDVGLRGAQLERAIEGSALKATLFTSVSAREASFEGARAEGLLLAYCDFTRANFFASDLRSARFTDSDFSGVRLAKANLRDAHFVGGHLKDADFSQANLTGVFYEPALNSIPYIPSLATTTGLSELHFETSAAALVELRGALRDAGLRQQEREVNYSIQRERWRTAIKDRKTIEPWFQYVFFDLTCKYGMDPGLPLRILLAGIFLFALPYFFAIVFRKRGGQAGIWVVRDRESVHKPGRRTRALAIAIEPGKSSTRLGRIRAVARALAIAFFFSLLSAFSIGFREINVRSWIARLQPREHTLRGTGWVRAVAGFQSLLSVYLLALWVLTYFGRPFE